MQLYMPKITAIITNYNGRSILENCLPETHAILVANGIREIILADDCSTDDSLDYISKNFPDIIISKTTQNSRFSINCNTAAKKATGDILFFLNNDMIPKKLDSKSVRHLFKNNPNLFSCSPKIELYANNQLINESTCNGHFKSGWLHVSSDKPTPGQLDLSQPFPILWSCGGAMFVDRTKFNALNGFSDIWFTAYFEDTDLGYRAWKMGLENRYLPTCVCFHHHQSTLKQLFTQKEINQLSLVNHYLFTWRNLTDKSYIASHLFSILSRFVFFQFNHIKAILKALTRFPQIWRFRREFKSKRSDSFVLSQFN